MTKSIRARAHGAIALAAAGAFASACGDEAAGGLPGTWGNDNAALPTCGALGRVCLANPLDAPLAIGGTTEFRIEVATAGGAGLAIDLQSAAPSIVEASGLTLSALAEGGTAILFTADDIVLDWLFVYTQALDAMRIVIFSQQGDLLGFAGDDSQLLIGDQAYFAVAPYASGAPLAGNFPLAIDIVGDSVRIIPDLTQARYRVIAQAAGSAVVTFSALDQQVIWNIEVLP
ncbi:MAG: hypothetical protein IPL79_12005 [Myxococcales bacterium]|nr:hypothetical protein [Myxococcales bacterium]